MKKRLTIILWLGILVGGFILLSAFGTVGETSPTTRHAILTEADDQLKRAAFEVLETKCNVCHRKQNPFMVFKEKNIEKRAAKIYQMVFVQRRMPKGTDIRLTNEEAATLEKWLLTQDIF